MATYWLVWPPDGRGGLKDHLVSGRLAVEGRLGRYSVDEVVHWIQQGDSFRALGGAGEAWVEACGCPASPRPHLRLQA